MTLVLFRRRALGKQCGAEQRLGRAFEKAVRRKPLARRTRDLCKLNGTREAVEVHGSRQGRAGVAAAHLCIDESMAEVSRVGRGRRYLEATETHFGETL